MMKHIFHQNKKLIAINDRKNIGRKGAKVLNSTLYCAIQWKYGCKSMVDFQNDPYGYIWWEIKNTNKKYSYSEATGDFSIVLLVST